MSIKKKQEEKKEEKKVRYRIVGRETARVGAWVYRPEDIDDKIADFLRTNGYKIEKIEE
ncbi:MAG: hypothetical protein KatS3mg031_2882 [Chitinophagales bacterium]|nr:MAG: hypothetical protein KatS3mg031_2882 [Chitinophagales bacterium]